MAYIHVKRVQFSPGVLKHINMNVVLFSVIIVAIILIIVTLFDWLFDGIFGILELIRDWRNGDDQESAIIDPLPKGQKGTLTYQPYSDEEKLKNELNAK